MLNSVNSVLSHAGPKGMCSKRWEHHQRARKKKNLTDVYRPLISIIWVRCQETPNTARMRFILSFFFLNFWTLWPWQCAHIAYNPRLGQKTWWKLLRTQKNSLSSSYPLSEVPQLNLLSRKCCYWSICANVVPTGQRKDDQSRSSETRRLWWRDI